MKSHIFRENRILVILLVVVAFTITATFFMPWIHTSLKTVIGLKIPQFNASVTKITNIINTFAPSKKEIAETGYAIYAIPILSILALVLIFATHIRISKNILLVTSILSIALSVYFYIRMNNSLSLSNVGSGVHLLFAISIVYVVSFAFLPKKKLPLIPETIPVEEDREVLANGDPLEEVD